MTTAFPPRHFDRNTWSASGMYEVEKSVPCRRLLQLQIPPLHMLRWRSTCFGRNDGGQVRHCETFIIKIKQQKMTGFINNNGVTIILTHCNSLDCFVPRNDGNLHRHCEPAKQSSNSRQ